MLEVLRSHKEWRDSGGDQGERAVLSSRNLDQLDLSGVELSYADLSGCSLSDTDLSHATLEGADLTGTNLRFSSLANSKIVRSSFTRAYMAFCDLRNADIRDSSFSGADLWGAKIEGAKLIEVELSGANLRAHDLSNRDFILLDLSSADLSECNLTGAKLRETDLSNANLRGVGTVGFWTSILRMFFPFYKLPFLLDDTRIVGARFSPNVQDPWSILRQSYTGPKFTFVLLATMLALLPLIGKAFFWTTVSGIERRALSQAVDPIQEAVTLLQAAPDPHWNDWVARSGPLLDRMRDETGRSLSVSDVEETYRMVEEGIEAIQHAEISGKMRGQAPSLLRVHGKLVLSQRLLHLIVGKGRSGLRERTILGLLIGRTEGLATSLMALVLISYNIGRGALTYFVGPLRDREERSQHSPAWADYWWLWRLHQVLSPILFLSFVSGAIQLVTTLLLTPVLVPA